MFPEAAPCAHRAKGAAYRILELAQAAGLLLEVLRCRFGGLFLERQMVAGGEVADGERIAVAPIGQLGASYSALGWTTPAEFRPPGAAFSRIRGCIGVGISSSDRY